MAMIHKVCRYACCCLVLTAAQVCAWLLSPYFRKKQIWIVSEKLTEARDNGYHFYKYLKEKHPEISSYYVIRKGATDQKKVDPLGNVVFADSFRHCLYYFGAKERICSQVHGVRPFESCPGLSRLFFYRLKGQRQINLKHGISKDYSDTFDFRKTGFDLYVAGAKPEYEYIKKTFDYPDKNIVLSGFCRFDALHGLEAPEKIILIMPTFREWLRTSDSAKERADKREAEAFLQSAYYAYYSKLLQNEQLRNTAAQTGYQIVFYLHYTFQPYAYLFDSLTAGMPEGQIVIARREQYDVQELLIRSAVLVTDYSSVMFDFAYMHKPVVYGQFDETEYRQKHYQKGYFDYRRDGFGPVFVSAEELCEYLSGLLRRGTELDEQYLRRVESFFQPYDDHNCDRVYDAILRLEE